MMVRGVERRVLVRVRPRKVGKRTRRVRKVRIVRRSLNTRRADRGAEGLRARWWVWVCWDLVWWWW